MREVPQRGGGREKKFPFCLKYGNKSNIFSPSVSCADSSLIRGSLDAEQTFSVLNDHLMLCSSKRYLISHITYLENRNISYLISQISYLRNILYLVSRILYLRKVFRRTLMVRRKFFNRNIALRGSRRQRWLSPALPWYRCRLPGRNSMRRWSSPGHRRSRW